MSIVVVMHDMVREADRTLRSLTSAYQQGSEGLDYEVVVIDHGSPKPLDAGRVEALDPRFRVIRVDDAPQSPLPAINDAVRRTDGDMIGLLIDGARILSPGLLAATAGSARDYPGPVVTPLSWHLGPDVPWRSIETGYTVETEDRSLDDIEWPADGYRLFEISSLTSSSARGWFGIPAESNALFIRRSTFDSLGGYDPRFVSPGGGLGNTDLFKRAAESPGSTLIALLGEGTFHQMHGGISTGGLPDRRRMTYEEFHREYVEIRGDRYHPPDVPVTHVGTVPQTAQQAIQRATRRLAEQLDSTTGRLDGALDTSRRLAEHRDQLITERDIAMAQYLEAEESLRTTAAQRDELIRERDRAMEMYRRAVGETDTPDPAAP